MSKNYKFSGASFNRNDWLDTLGSTFSKDFDVWSDGRLANMQSAVKYAMATNSLHEMGIAARSQNLDIGSRVRDLLQNSYYYGDSSPGAGYSYQGDVSARGGGKDGGYTKSVKAWKWDGNYAKSAPAPTPSIPRGGGGGGGAPGNVGASSPYMPEIPTMPDPPEFRYAPGGTGASVDAAATGFRRKKSSARTAGLTAKGTSQFKISGQTARSSGLNIGV